MKRLYVPYSKFCLTWATLLLITSSGVHSARAEDEQSLEIPDQAASHLKRYCFRCHGEKLQKGDREFITLVDGKLSRQDSLELLEEALDAMNRGDMPPRKKGVLHPSREANENVIQAMTEFLEARTEAGQSSTTTLRRLNRFEYQNTLRDLLGLHTEALDLTGEFPVDAIEDGFDNNGAALTLSDLQLQRYLDVAEDAIAESVYFDSERPRPQTWMFDAPDFNGVTSYERAPVTWRLIVDDEYLEIGHGQPSERHPTFAKPLVRQDGVPSDGWYTIRIRAAAANRNDHGYDHTEFERFRTVSLKLALWIAPDVRLLDKNAADQRRLVKIWDLSDGKPGTLAQRVWLTKGAVPFVSWSNGVSSKGNIRRVAEKHHPEVIRVTKTQLDAAQSGNREAQALVARLKKNSSNKILSEVYRGPRVRLWSMEIEGPQFEQWPPASHRLLFGEQTDASLIDIRDCIRKFASRAFRRQVSDAEVSHYVAYVHQQIEDGDSHSKAIQKGLAAVLTSPRFLYLDEGNSEKEQVLTQFELATRLSYFLWSSMPDAELLKLAAEGRLDADTLEAQTLRMLADEKSRGFVEHFTDSWLRINTLGEMPPDPKAFESYYRDRLETLFRQETQLFFADLLHRNGSIVNFLDSDYSFLNDALATHYGIEGVRGESFRRVSFSPDHHRGGLLGQGGVLTLTANGIETSPVVRGVWVLENIFGTPPSPPPPDVEPLEPDTRGTTSIREQLDRHRTVEACASCHRKIDPAGFALEFYDPIGAYRKTYPRRSGKTLSIDGAGELPSGERFEDEQGLKRLLVDRKQQFAAALAEKLLTYATGRTMTFRDREEIQQVARQCEEQQYGLRSLVLAVVRSRTFGNR